MKRLIAMLLAVCMLLAFSACGQGSTTDITIKNDTGNTIDNVYISSADSDSWGDPIIPSKLANGSSVKVDSALFLVENTTIYDFGAIDDTGINYDVYEIPLSAGDSLVLTETTLTVTDANGNVTEYDAYVYAQ